MSYDGSENPRYIRWNENTTGNIATVNVTPLSEQERNELERDAETVAQLRVMFKTPAWRYIDSMISEDVERLTTHLRGVKTLEDLHRMCGELKAYERLLALPRDIESEYQRVSQALEDG